MLYSKRLFNSSTSESTRVSVRVKVSMCMFVAVECCTAHSCSTPALPPRVSCTCLFYFATPSAPTLLHTHSNAWPSVQAGTRCCSRQPLHTHHTGGASSAVPCTNSIAAAQPGRRLPRLRSRGRCCRSQSRHRRRRPPMTRPTAFPTASSTA